MNERRIWMGIDDLDIGLMNAGEVGGGMVRGEGRKGREFYLWWGGGEVTAVYKEPHSARAV